MTNTNLLPKLNSLIYVTKTAVNEATGHERIRHYPATVHGCGTVQGTDGVVAHGIQGAVPRNGCGVIGEKILHYSADRAEDGSESKKSFVLFFDDGHCY